MFKFIKKKYTKKDLVEFGNYLLSKERENDYLFCKDYVDTRQVQDSDLKNWEQKKK